MLRLTDVVKQLLIINAILFLLSVLPVYKLLPFDLAMYFPGSDLFRPYQVVTHMFMHGSVSHFFFNMLMLISFGPTLEAFLGSKRFLFYYLFCGLGSILLHTLFWYWELKGYPAEILAQYGGSVVGASGALYGILVAFGMYFPDRELLLLIPPIPMKAKYLVIFSILLELYMVNSESQTQVAHFAHLGGALFGFLIILYWRKTGR